MSDWVEQEAKILRCREGNHDFSDQDGAVSFYREGEENTYCCLSCDKKRRIRVYLATGVITSKTMIDAVIASRRCRCNDWVVEYWVEKLDMELAEIEAAAKIWEARVWFGGKRPDLDDGLTEPYTGLLDTDFRSYLNKKLDSAGLQHFVLNATQRGYNSETALEELANSFRHRLKYTSYSSAGRHLFQIENTDENHFVSFISDEESPQPRGGIQGIQATKEQAISMFLQAVEDWESGKLVFKPDGGLGVL